MGLPEYHMPISGVSIYQIEMHANDGRYDLNAPYQRDTVWDVTRRRNLIRSILMGIPTGTLILSDLPYREGSEHYFRVVDGKQRIETIHLFTNDGFTVPADWFSEPHTDWTPPASEIHYSDLPRPLQRKFTNRTTSIITVKLDKTTQWVDEGTPGARQVTAGWVLHTDRTDDEILAAEAELYLLINRGGVPHGEDDLTVARQLATEVK